MSIQRYNSQTVTYLQILGLQGRYRPLEWCGLATVTVYYYALHVDMPQKVGGAINRSFKFTFFYYKCIFPYRSDL